MNQTFTSLFQRKPARILQQACTLVAIAAVSSFGSCKKHSEHDGHDHGSESAHDTSDGHAHDHASDSHDHDETEHVDEVQLTADAIQRYGIEVRSVAKMTLTPTIAAPARVALNTEAMAHVGSHLQGRVVEVRTRLGEVVKQGDTLLIVESLELGEAQADYLQKHLLVQTTLPNVDLTKVGWERAKSLFEQSQGISLTEVQKREAEYKAALAAQKTAEAAAVGAKNRLYLLGMDQKAVEELTKTSEVTPRYAIRASIDGAVIEREVTLGELVGPDRDALMVLADMSKLWVLADVPEGRFLEVAIGATAKVNIGTAAESESHSFSGTVAYIAPLIDTGTRTAQVRIECPADSLRLKPGMFALTEITVANTHDTESVPVVVVPEAAIQTVEGGPAVFVPVEGEPGTFAKRAVTIGRATAGLVPVFSGLAVGEQCVVSGSFILKAELGKGSAAHEH